MKNLLKNKYFQHKETIHNFIWRVLQVFGKQGITFLIFILCAKLLTPYDFGIYNYILTIIFFLIIFCDFGISTATSKYVAEYNTIDKKKLKAILFNSLIILLSLGFILTLLTVLFGKFLLREKYIFVLYALPLLFLTPISSLYDGIFRGLKRFKELAIISLSVGFFSIFFVYLLVKNFGLIGALVSQNLFYFALVLTLSSVYRNLHFQFNKKLMKIIFPYSILIGISTIAYFLYSRADILILGYFGYITEIGYYEIISRVFNFLVFPISILAQVIAPNIATLNAQKKYAVILGKLKKFLTIIVPSGILITIFFYFLFPLLLKFFLKEYYTAETILIFKILIFVFPFKLWGIFLTQSFIISTGYVKISTIIVLIGGILNVIFDYILISILGFIGVFWSTLIIHNISIILTSFIFLRKIKNENLL